MQVRAGVNNVCDKDPPFLPGGDVANVSTSVLNTFSTYDVLGREIFLALRATF